MFDGREFLGVARHLLGGVAAGGTDHEALYRTAVGRSYYACFHVLRRALCDPAGWARFGKGGRKVFLTHQQLRRLVIRRLPVGSVDLFDSLREMREHADYHSWKPSVGGAGGPPTCLCSTWGPDPKANAESALEVAEELLTQLPQ